MEKKILEGITILDLTRFLAGPHCARLLGDMGANIIKIEARGTGDTARNVCMYHGESAYFMVENRNKRGVTLNLKSPRGKELFLGMAAKADVIIENFRPGVMDKLGIGYSELKKQNPGIIYCAISGFGQTGPYRNRAGFDIVAQAMSGMMSCSGFPDRGPTRAGAPIGDVAAGIHGALGILGAILYRNQTGVGQMVDVSLVDCLISMMTSINMVYLQMGRMPTLIGNQYENACPYDTFKTKDGYAVVAPVEHQWPQLCEIMGIPEYGNREGFETEAKRITNRAKVEELVTAWTVTKTSQEVIETLQANGIPTAPIMNIAQVVADPHFSGAREMFINMEHPVAGTVKITNNPIKFSETPTKVFIPSPTLGQHNHEVYHEMLGLSDEEIEQLQKDEVI